LHERKRGRRDEKKLDKESAPSEYGGFLPHVGGCGRVQDGGGSMDRAQRLVDQFLTESLSLPFVPRGGFHEIVDRQRADDDPRIIGS
jgi:hypothetical protein